MYLEKVYLNANEEKFNVEGFTWEEMEVLLNDTPFKDELLEGLDIPKDTEEVRVLGVGRLVEKVLRLEGEFVKSDVVVGLKDTKFEGFAEIEKNKEYSELLLNIGSEERAVETIYDVKNEYPKLLELESFSKACAKGKSDYSTEVNERLRESYQEVFNRNREILGGLDSKRKVYRLIEHNGKEYVRALVSNRYHDYNNLIALYLSIYILDRVSMLNNQVFEVRELDYTDSEIKLSFARLDRVQGEVRDVLLGINLRNNEISEGSLSLSITYFLENKGKKMHLNPNNPREKNKVTKKVFTCSHLLGEEKLIERVNRAIDDMVGFEDDLKELNEKLKSNRLTGQFMEKVTRGFLNSKKVRGVSKKRVEELKESVSMAMSIIDFLGRIDELEMEYEDKDYISYLCYKAIDELKVSEDSNKETKNIKSEIKEEVV